MLKRTSLIRHSHISAVIPSRIGSCMHLARPHGRMNSAFVPCTARGQAPRRSFVSSRPVPPRPNEAGAADANATTATPKPINRTGNMLTFLAATAIGVGAYVYEYNKTGLPWNPFAVKPKGLNTEKWTPILLKNITKVSTNTSLFEFELPEPCDIPITSAIYVKDDLIQAMRAYTPIHTWDPYSSASSEAVPEPKTTKVQFLIKRYSEGQVSRFLHSARPGKKIEMRGPVTIWPANEPELDKWDEIGMIAGGTGITAFLPIIHTALRSSTNQTRLSLIFAAREPEELYFKKELDDLAKKYPNRFKVIYTVDRVPEEESSWQGQVGFVQRSMVEKVLPQPATPATLDGEAQDAFDKKSVVLVCGPESMINHIAGSPGLSGRAPISGLLGAMGYTLDQVVRFPN